MFCFSESPLLGVWNMDITRETAGAHDGSCQGIPPGGQGHHAQGMGPPGTEAQDGTLCYIGNGTRQYREFCPLVVRLAGAGGSSLGFPFTTWHI